MTPQTDTDRYTVFDTPVGRLVILKARDGNGMHPAASDISGALHDVLTLNDAFKTASPETAGALRHSLAGAKSSVYGLTGKLKALRDSGAPFAVIDAVERSQHTMRLNLQQIESGLFRLEQ
jgi:hypothetical protein